MFYLLLPIIGRELDPSYGQIGFIMTCQYIAGAIANVPGGNICYQAVLAGHSVLFTTAAQLLLDLAGQDSARGLERRLRHYCRPALLCELILRRTTAAVNRSRRLRPRKI